MKKHLAWVGAVAVIAAMGFSGYAVADSPDVAARNLNVSGYTSLGGPVIFQSDAYGAQGGPAGIGTVYAGHRCVVIQLDGASTDGGGAGADNDRPLAYATLSGTYPAGLAVGSAEVLPNGTFLTGRLRVCLTKATTDNALFNYLLLNVDAVAG